MIKFQLIKKLRKHFNLTLEDLSSLSGISIYTLSAVERGHAPTLSVLKSIGRTFKVDYRLFLEDPDYQITNNHIVE